MEDDYFPSSTQLIQGNIRLFLLLILVFNIILVCYFKLKRKSREFVAEITKKLKNKEVLILIAHPDDETIFFFPTMKCLLSKYAKINILCLSNGDYYNEGNVREKEMNILKEYLHLYSVEIVKNDNLKDDITKLWDTKIVAQEVTNYLTKNKNIGVIFTFDHKGVSKHPNHISCYNGITYKIILIVLD